MGVGQSSMMGIVGAVGSAGVAARMVGTEANQQIATGQSAQQETNRLSIENKQDVVEQQVIKGKELSAQMDAEEAIGDFNAAQELEADAKTPADKQFLREQRINATGRMLGAADEVAKAQQAFEVLQDKIAARNFMMENNKKAIARAQRWGGLK